MKTGFYGISDTLDTMMENRIYGKNTVDAVLQDNAVILEESNASFLYRKPDVVQYRFEEYITQRKILSFIAHSIVHEEWDEKEKIHKLAAFTSQMEVQFPMAHEANEKAYPSPDHFFWGGSEEMLIAKGTDWCAEVARVFCALAQALKIPTRIVYTFSDTDGHILNESFVEGQWLLVDSTSNLVYCQEGQSYSALDVARCREEGKFGSVFGQYEAYYCAPEFFTNIGIAEYVLADAEKYSYRIRFCNEYYREALKEVWN